MESAEEGRMSTPRPIQSDDLDKYSICRRIDVVEYREYEVDEVSPLIIISSLSLLRLVMCFKPLLILTI